MKHYFYIARNIFDMLLVLVIITMAVHPRPVMQQFVDLQRLYWQDNAVRSVFAQEKVVALTFDDGPDPRFTPRILAILRRQHIHATFFMIGRQIEKYPALAKQVITDGNSIENHTYSHPDLPLDSRVQVMRELDHCEQLIERTTGTHAHLFRPPLGMLSNTIINQVEHEGYRTILWTVCADHHDAPTPALMAARVLQHTRPGTIILLHDGTLSSRWKDVEATALIITGLQQQGYHFVTIPELLALKEKPPALVKKKSRQWTI